MLKQMTISKCNTRGINISNIPMQRKLLFISNRFSGLDSFLACKEPTGMPAVYLLMNMLVARGYEIYWIVMGKDNLHQDTFDLLDGKIHVTLCEPPGNSWINKINRSKLRHLKLGQTAYGLVCLWKALRLLRYINVNLVYGAGPTGALVAGIAALIHRLPRISRLYGSLLYFSRKEGRAEWLYFDYPAEVFVFKWPGDAIILTNDGTRCDQLAKRFRTDPGKVYFLLNGVEKCIPDKIDALRADIRQRLGLKEGTVMLATVSRLSDWKRVDRAIQAMAVMQQQSIDCRLIVVGDGPDRYKYEALAASIGLSGYYITFMGALPHKEAMEILRSADIFLSLYDYSNLANPVIEAMIAGRCIVSIADGSLDGILSSGQNSILVDPVNLENDLTAQLIMLIQNPELRQQLGIAAAQTADATFWTWGQRLSAEIDIIEGLCLGDYKMAKPHPE